MLIEGYEMPLRFDLGPFEKLFIGKSVLTNGGDRTTFIVEGDTPILRARDVLTPEQAVTSSGKLYRCVQQMYLEEDIAKSQGSYLALAAQVISDLPGCSAEVQNADRLIKSGQHYKALKELKKLMERHANTVSGAQTKGFLPQVAVRAHN
jgi:flagellar biosynthesis repressor protein FlbT